MALSLLHCSNFMLPSLLCKAWAHHIMQPLNIAIKTDIVILQPTDADKQNSDSSSLLILCPMQCVAPEASLPVPTTVTGPAGHNNTRSQPTQHMPTISTLRRPSTLNP